MKLEKRVLQFCVLVAALVPILAGAAGVVAGSAMVTHQVGDASLDSHFRYLSGLLLAIGLAYWSVIPGIERKAGRVRLLTALVVVGGLARLYGLVAGATPDLSMRLALVMELGVTPLLCIWQARVAAQDPGARSPGFRLPVTPGRAAPRHSDPSPGR